MADYLAFSPDSVIWKTMNSRVERVIRIRKTKDTMVKIKRTKGQTTIYEGLAVPAPLVAPVVLI